jgi:hypothetical protein
LTDLITVQEFQRFSHHNFASAADNRNRIFVPPENMELLPLPLKKKFAEEYMILYLK